MALVFGIVGGVDGGHEFVLGALDVLTAGGVEELHFGTAGQTFFDEGPNGGVCLVGTAGELVAPAADLVIHGAVQLALGTVGFGEFFAEHIENLVLQAILPLALGFEGGGLVALQFVGFEVFAALVVGFIVLGFSIESVAEIGVGGDEFLALHIA